MCNCLSGIAPYSSILITNLESNGVLTRTGTQIQEDATFPDALFLVLLMLRLVSKHLGGCFPTVNVSLGNALADFLQRTQTGRKSFSGEESYSMITLTVVTYLDIIFFF